MSFEKEIAWDQIESLLQSLLNKEEHELKKKGKEYKRV